MEIPQKTKNRTTIWSSNSKAGYTSKENKNTNSKRYMHLNVHSNIIYNSQLWKQSKCPSTVSHWCVAWGLGGRVCSVSHWTPLTPPWQKWGTDSHCLMRDGCSISSASPLNSNDSFLAKVGPLRLWSCCLILGYSDSNCITLLDVNFLSRENQERYDFQLGNEKTKRSKFTFSFQETFYLTNLY